MEISPSPFLCPFSPAQPVSKSDKTVTALIDPPIRARAVQLLLGHTKLESTVRYLGIEVGDALEIAEQTEV